MSRTCNVALSALFSLSDCVYQPPILTAEAVGADPWVAGDTSGPSDPRGEDSGTDPWIHSDGHSATGDDTSSDGGDSPAAGDGVEASDPGVPVCPGTTEWCVDRCVDRMTDPAACGGCTTVCTDAWTCVAELCRDPTSHWSAVIQEAIDSSAGAGGFDLASDGVVGLFTYVPQGSLLPATYSGSDTGWSVGPSFPTAGFDSASPLVAAAVQGGAPWVATYAGPNASPRYLHVLTYTAGGWLEVGAPGSPLACSGPDFMKLVVDLDRPHVTSHGAGGCGIGVDYRTFDGSNWIAHLGVMNAGQITTSAAGTPGLATVSGVGIVGVPESISGPPNTVTHTVRKWVGSTWHPVADNLDAGVHDTNMGAAESMSMSMAADGALCVAWSENRGGASAGRDVRVKCLAQGATQWTSVGASTINEGGDAADPSLAFFANTLWVAYVAKTSGGDDRVYVRCFNAPTNAWLQIGAAVNVAFAGEANHPLVIGLAGLPSVAWSQAVSSGGLAVVLCTFP